MRLRSSAIAVVATAALVLTACGGEDTAEEGAAPPETSATSSPTPSEPASSEATPTPTEEAPAGTVIEVTISGGEVTPAGARIEAAVGQPITFAITSDVAGEIHVHSAPEHSIDFEPGDSEHSITIDRPGVVEVELHDPAILVAQLEVR